MLGKFINTEEDSLTASVIGHLVHLPAELFWQILRTACISNQLPKVSGEIQQLDFWPKWDSTETGNSRYVEPDVFLSFSDFDLIIEAKRWDKGMQNPAQWKREVTGYLNEYGSKRIVYLLALGGICDSADTEVLTNDPGAKDKEVNCPVIKCRWTAVMDQCKLLQKDRTNLRLQTFQDAATVRILDDVIDLFGWHGFTTGRWFSDCDFERHRLPADKPTYSLFRDISKRHYQ